MCYFHAWIIDSAMCALYSSCQIKILKIHKKSLIKAPKFFKQSSAAEHETTTHGWHIIDIVIAFVLHLMRVHALFKIFQKWFGHKAPQE